jgi:DNA-binding beta-propeller fold protein YncE
MKRSSSISMVLLLAAVAACTPAPEPFQADQVSAHLNGHPDTFSLFESGQVRPIALSPDGDHLYVTNTPDNRLEIFRIRNTLIQPLEHIGTVRVGLEPVAVAARNDSEVWVVNHLSDSVSIIDVSEPRRSRVVRTLLVGDEPRDIVFAGPGRKRAFITAAHRGQNNPNDPQLTTPGVGRADVWVFHAGQLGAAPGGVPLTILTLFTDTPRALAVSPDGTRVYAAGLLTGNRTTILHDLVITNGRASAPDGRGMLPPDTNFQGVVAPETGMIVKFDGEHWVDEAGRWWDDEVKLNLPDKDVFAIDAMANPPAQVPGQAGTFAGVGTVLYNMAVNPVSGKVYVSNTEALNQVRFEGPGIFGGTTVRGHMHENRITVLDGTSVLPRHLDKHVDFDSCCAPLPNSENDRSLALPVSMVVSSDGSTLYVAAMGSSKIGVFDTAELENDTFVPDTADHIEVSGGGPTGIELDEARDRLYVLTRFDNAISVVDTGTGSEIAHVSMFNPEPASVLAGRRFLYDARFTSSNGTSACASCHVFGDFDGLAWDLGNPDAMAAPSPELVIAPPFAELPNDDFHPMKGPMATQSLRGMDNHGPMHWRGDRTGFDDVPSSAQPDTGVFDESKAFNEFNEAFVALLGRHEELTPAEMQAFTDFSLQILYPPNPIRQLDNGLTAAQARGKAVFENDITEFLGGAEMTCRDCHVTDADGNAEHGVARPGFFGSNGLGLIEGDDFLTLPNGNDLQHLKVPHLRNMYQKVGMFGNAFFSNTLPHQDNSHQGDQIRGFGFLHDGSTDTVFRFMQVLGFSDTLAPEGFPSDASGDPMRRDMESFMLAFDSNVAPVVGQQVTLTASNGAAVDSRIDLLIERASTNAATMPTPHAPLNPHGPECELVVTTRPYGKERGYLYVDDLGLFVSSKDDEPARTDAQLRARASLAPLTYTCVPLGSGRRIALDADLDGCFDLTELQAGNDPRDASSTPPGCSSGM